MPTLTILFFSPSSTPSVLIDGEHSGPILRDFIGYELRPLTTCKDFLRELEELKSGATHDFGFGNAVALSVNDGKALLEHAVSDIPSYELPLTLLVSIVRAWAVALSSRPHEFSPQSFEIPEPQLPNHHAR
jgi:hypothetical protein